MEYYLIIIFLIISTVLILLALGNIGTEILKIRADVEFLKNGKAKDIIKGIVTDLERQK